MTLETDLLDQKPFGGTDGTEILSLTPDSGLGRETGGSGSTPRPQPDHPCPPKNDQVGGTHDVADQFLGDSGDHGA